MKANATLIGSPDGPERVEIVDVQPTYVTILTATDGHAELSATDGKVNNGMTLKMDGQRKNKYVYLFVVQGHYGHGWEDLTASEDRNEARANLRDYRDNDPAPTRLIRRRELNETRG